MERSLHTVLQARSGKSTDRQEIMVLEERRRSVSSSVPDQRATDETERALMPVTSMTSGERERFALCRTTGETSSGPSGNTRSVTDSPEGTSGLASTGSGLSGDPIGECSGETSIANRPYSILETMDSLGPSHVNVQGASAAVNDLEGRSMSSGVVAGPYACQNVLVGTSYVEPGPFRPHEFSSEIIAPTIHVDIMKTKRHRQSDCSVSSERSPRDRESSVVQTEEEEWHVRKRRTPYCPEKRSLNKSDATHESSASTKSVDQTTILLQSLKELLKIQIQDTAQRSLKKTQLQEEDTTQIYEQKGTQERINDSSYRTTLPADSLEQIRRQGQHLRYEDVAAHHIQEDNILEETDDNISLRPAVFRTSQILGSLEELLRIRAQHLDGRGRRSQTEEEDKTENYDAIVRALDANPNISTSLIISTLDNIIQSQNKRRGLQKRHASICREEMKQTLEVSVDHVPDHEEQPQKAQKESMSEALRKPKDQSKEINEGFSGDLSTAGNIPKELTANSTHDTVEVKSAGHSLNVGPTNVTDTSEESKQILVLERLFSLMRCQGNNVPLNDDAGKNAENNLEHGTQKLQIHVSNESSEGTELRTTMYTDTKCMTSEQSFVSAISPRSSGSKFIGQISLSTSTDYPVTSNSDRRSHSTHMSEDSQNVCHRQSKYPYLQKEKSNGNAEKDKFEKNNETHKIHIENNNASSNPRFQKTEMAEIQNESASVGITQNASTEISADRSVENMSRFLEKENMNNPRKEKTEDHKHKKAQKQESSANPNAKEQQYFNICQQEPGKNKEETFATVNVFQKVKYPSSCTISASSTSRFYKEDVNNNPEKSNIEENHKQNLKREDSSETPNTRVDEAGTNKEKETVINNTSQNVKYVSSSATASVETAIASGPTKIRTIDALKEKTQELVDSLLRRNVHLPQRVRAPVQRLGTRLNESAEGISHENRSGTSGGGMGPSKQEVEALISRSGTCSTLPSTRPFIFSRIPGSEEEVPRNPLDEENKSRALESRGPSHAKLGVESVGMNTGSERLVMHVFHEQEYVQNTLENQKILMSGEEIYHVDKSQDEFDVAACTASASNPVSQALNPELTRHNGRGSSSQVVSTGSFILVKGSTLSNPTPGSSRSTQKPSSNPIRGHAKEMSRSSETNLAGDTDTNMNPRKIPYQNSGDLEIRKSTDPGMSEREGKSNVVAGGIDTLEIPDTQKDNVSQANGTNPDHLIGKTDDKNLRDNSQQNRRKFDVNSKDSGILKTDAKSHVLGQGLDTSEQSLRAPISLDYTTNTMSNSALSSNNPSLAIETWTYDKTDSAENHTGSLSIVSYEKDTCNPSQKECGENRNRNQTTSTSEFPEQIRPHTISTWTANDIPYVRGEQTFMASNLESSPAIVVNNKNTSPPHVSTVGMNTRSSVVRKVHKSESDSNIEGHSTSDERPTRFETSLSGRQNPSYTFAAQFPQSTDVQVGNIRRLDNEGRIVSRDSTPSSHHRVRTKSRNAQVEISDINSEKGPWPPGAIDTLIKETIALIRKCQNEDTDLKEHEQDSQNSLKDEHKVPSTLGGSQSTAKNLVEPHQLQEIDVSQMRHRTSLKSGDVDETQSVKKRVSFSFSPEPSSDTSRRAPRKSETDSVSDKRLHSQQERTRREDSYLSAPPPREEPGTQGVETVRLEQQSQGFPKAITTDSLVLRYATERYLRNEFPNSPNESSQQTTSVSTSTPSAYTLNDSRSDRIKAAFSHNPRAEEDSNLEENSLHQLIVRHSIGVEDTQWWFERRESPTQGSIQPQNERSLSGEHDSRDYKMNESSSSASEGIKSLSPFLSSVPSATQLEGRGLTKSYDGVNSSFHDQSGVTNPSMNTCISEICRNIQELGITDSDNTQYSSRRALRIDPKHFESAKHEHDGRKENMGDDSVEILSDGTAASRLSAYSSLQQALASSSILVAPMRPEHRDCPSKMSSFEQTRRTQERSRQQVLGSCPDHHLEEQIACTRSNLSYMEKCTGMHEVSRGRSSENDRRMSERSLDMVATEDSDIYNDPQRSQHRSRREVCEEERAQVKDRRMTKKDHETAHKIRHCKQTRDVGTCYPFDVNITRSAESSGKTHHSKQLRISKPSSPCESKRNSRILEESLDCSQMSGMPYTTPKNIVMPVAPRQSSRRSLRLFDETDGAQNTIKQLKNLQNLVDPGPSSDTGRGRRFPTRRGSTSTDVDGQQSAFVRHGSTGPQGAADLRRLSRIQKRASMRSSLMSPKRSILDGGARPREEDRGVQQYQEDSKAAEDVGDDRVAGKEFTMGARKITEGSRRENERARLSTELVGGGLARGTDAENDDEEGQSASNHEWPREGMGLQEEGVRDVRLSQRDRNQKNMYDTEGTGRLIHGLPKASDKIVKSKMTHADARERTQGDERGQHRGTIEEEKRHQYVSRKSREDEEILHRSNGAPNEFERAQRTVRDMYIHKRDSDNYAALEMTQVGGKDINRQSRHEKVGDFHPRDVRKREPSAQTISKEILEALLDNVQESERVGIDVIEDTIDRALRYISQKGESIAQKVSREILDDILDAVQDSEREDTYATGTKKELATTAVQTDMSWRRFAMSAANAPARADCCAFAAPGCVPRAFALVAPGAWGLCPCPSVTTLSAPMLQTGIACYEGVGASCVGTPPLPEEDCKPCAHPPRRGGRVPRSRSTSSVRGEKLSEDTFVLFPPSLPPTADLPSRQRWQSAARACAGAVPRRHDCLFLPVARRSSSLAARREGAAPEERGGGGGPMDFAGLPFAQHYERSQTRRGRRRTS